MIRVYFGHHKCASQYIKAVFLQATALLGLGSSRSDALSQELPLGYHLREPFVTRLAQHRAQLLSGSAAVLCLTNADAEAVVLLERYGDYKGFHVTECVNKSETRKRKELLSIQRRKSRRMLAGIGKHNVKW